MAPIIEPRGPPDPDEPLAPLSRRLAWFFGLAAAGAAATLVAAYALKALLPVG